MASLPSQWTDASEDEWSWSQHDAPPMDPVVSHGFGQFLIGSGTDGFSRPRPQSYLNMQSMGRNRAVNGADEPRRAEHEPQPTVVHQQTVWKCIGCGSTQWMNLIGLWQCRRCYGTQFKTDEDPATDSSGTWVWVPSSPPNPTPGERAGVRKPEKHQVANGDGDDPGDGSQEGREHAESEVLTADPSIDPETLEPLPRLSRRKRRAQKKQQAANERAQSRLHPGDQGRPGSSGDGPSEETQRAPAGRKRTESDQWRDDVLKQLTKPKDSEWTVQKGPAPGIKYRSGQPPLPPSWSYGKDDPRAFSKWERKMQVWRIQIASYLPPSEAAMLLYTSLRGEAEEELEWVDLSKVNSPGGIDFIIEALRKPLQTREVYLKRRYLFEYEGIQRQNGETIRSFCNRYHRCERTLAAIGIDVTTMYDTESRGARLLDRLRLNVDQQRMILIGSGQSINFDDVREAAILQFPDHRPTPYVTHMREFDWNKTGGKPQDREMSTPNHYAPSKGQSTKGRGKGKDNGKKGAPRTAYVTEHNAEADENNAEDETADDGEQEEGDDDEHQEDHAEAGDEEKPDEEEEGEPDESDLALAAHCLTVTARRLSGLRLGRKFSGSKSVSQRKKESHCVACGERGHWKGDPECPHYDGSASNNASTNTAKNDKGNRAEKGSGKAKGKKVLAVTSSSGKKSLVPIIEETPNSETYGSYFVHMVKHPVFEVPSFQVFKSDLKSLAKYLVLDTACQRTCCSSKWLAAWESQVATRRLHAKKIPNKEPFEFGHGDTQYSNMHAYLPTCFDESLCLIGTCVIDSTNDIPLLGSNSLLFKLQAVVDLPRQQVRLEALGETVPLLVINNHVAIDMTKFSEDVHKDPAWIELSKISDEECADVEFITLQPPLQQQQREGSSATDSFNVKPEIINAPTTAMVAELEKVPILPAPGREVPDQMHVPSSQTTAEDQGLAGPSRSDGHGATSNADGEVGGTVHPRPHPTVGEPARKVQQVPGVRQKVALERGSTTVGRSTSFAKRAAAAAFTVFVHSCSLRGSQLHPECLPGYQAQASGMDFDTFYTSNGIQDPRAEEDPDGEAEGHGNQGQEEGGSFQGKSTTCQEGDGTGHGGRDERGFRRLRLGSGGSQSVKTGQKTWITGHLKSMLKLYDKECQIYKTLATHADHVKSGSKIDVMEVFANRARVSELAPKFGLSASQPIDEEFGFDLLTEQGQQDLWSAIHRLKPLLVIVAWPCTEWCIFNQNMNYSGRLDELEDKREEQRPLVRLGVKICEHQRDEGRLYLGENPLRSALWKEPEVQELAEHVENYSPWCHAGAYGAETKDGFPVQKGHRWQTNSLLISKQLEAKLTEEQKAYTKPIEGADTKASGEYCPGLSCAILEGLQMEARSRCPQRFHVQDFSSRCRTRQRGGGAPGRRRAGTESSWEQCQSGHEVLFVRPRDDVALWSNILDEVERRFSGTFKKPFDLQDPDDLYIQICQLVPWELVKVQAAWTPLTRRWPGDLPFTHRGSVIRTMTGKVVVESEDLVSVAYPKQRFADAVRCGIFFYGNAPDDPVEKEDGRAPEAPSADSSRVPGFNTDIRFVGGPPMSREMRASIARLHCNLGHPPKAEIVRILAAAGKLDSKILAALDALQCGSCIRMSKAVKPQTSSTSSVMKYSGCFGDHLQADIIYIRLLDSKAYPVLGITCMSTNYHAAKVVDNRTPEHVLDVMKEVWYRPFGLPISVQVDPDGCFLGPNQEWHQNLGIEHLVIPPEEAWRLGKIGRRNALVRTLAERLIDQNGATKKTDLDDILVAVLHSINTSTYSYGRSPCQAVFGRIPRPVGDILSDNQALTISPQVHQGHGALKPELLRAEALTALAQFSASQAVKRAILRKTRTQKDLTDLLPGQAVAYWRMSGKARQHKRGAWNLARFLAWDPDKKSAWVQVGKHSVRVGTTQLRAASGWENWTPSESDLKLIKDAKNDIANGLWLEDAGAAPDEEEHLNADEEIFEFPARKRKLGDVVGAEDVNLEEEPETPYPQEELFASAGPSQPYNLSTVPVSAERSLQHLQHQHAPEEPEPSQPSQLQIQHQLEPVSGLPQLPSVLPGTLYQHLHQATTHQHQQTHQNIQFNLNIDSPTYQNFGAQPSFGPLPPTPRSRGAPYLAQPTTPRAGQSMPLESGEASGPEQRPALMDESHQSLMTKTLEDALDIYDNGSAEPKAVHWDGSPDLKNPFFDGNHAYNIYLASSARKTEMEHAGVTTDIGRPDEETSDDEDMQLSNQRGLTRQEMKQLDREIPWREIVNLPLMMRQKYVESATKEYNGWMDWHGIRPLSDAEAQEVRRDPRLRRRIMKSRAAYRDKARGQGQLRAKTRVVIIGCGDPDLRQLTRDSPTPSRLSEFVILSSAAAGMNRQFNHDGRLWKLWISDAAQAFLQGRQDESERGGPLFMEPPRDPIQVEAGSFPSDLYQIQGNCYGLANAPRVWYNKVKESMLASGFVLHSFDRCFFQHFDGGGQLDAMAIVHVDDFLVVYSETFNLSLLEEMFRWGSVTKVDEDNPGVYRGKEISCIRDKDNRRTLKVTQKAFVENLVEGRIKKGRLKDPDQKLTPEEWQEMRSVTGCLQWLGGQSRPDVAAVSSLSNGQETTVQDLKRVHDALSYVKSTPESGITFPAVSFGRGSTIVTYTDSSWANAQNHASQYGVMILACPGQVSETTTSGFVLDWKSGRSPRICRSTLAAEAISADEGADRASFINLFLTEIFTRKPAYRGSMEMSMVHAVDAKSLYDSLVAENPSLSEKRSMINVRSVQQILSPNQIHWVPRCMQTI